MAVPIFLVAIIVLCAFIRNQNSCTPGIIQSLLWKHQIFCPTFASH